MEWIDGMSATEAGGLGAKLLGRDSLLPVVPFGLEVFDIFGKGFQEAEIEPVGRPDSVLLDFVVGHMYGIHVGVLLLCDKWQANARLRLV